MNGEPARVLEALKRSENEWMTVDGIARETQISRQDVALILESLALAGRVTQQLEAAGTPVYANNPPVASLFSAAAKLFKQSRS